MSKGSATTTTSTAPNPVAGQAYDQLIQQAGQVAATPYQAYTGELTAPINQQQQSGVGTINQYATSAVPYLQGAESTIQGAAQPLTQAQIQQYQSPYTQDVVNATEAQFNNQNAQQQQQVLGNAAAQGALGGDRTAVAQSVLAGQQQAQEAPVIAGLENQGYTQALATAGQQFQQNPEQAAYGEASTGTALENAGLTGANAQFGAGTAEQQTQQAQDTAAYQQYEQALQYPFATLGWEAGIDTGVGSQLGGTSSTTAPPPNYTAQLLGAGIGAGAAVLSDKRAKENLKKVGKLNDGQSVYRFNYKGDPTTRIGLVAQEVERDHPEAVHQTDGWKSVDYDAATKDAVRRLLGGRVQGLATGGTPYGGTGPMPYAAGTGWVPTMSITGGSGAPKPPSAPNQQQQSGIQSPQQMVQNAYKIAGSPGVSSAFNTGTTELASGMNASDLSALTGEDADVSSAALAAMPFGENRGGRVPRAYGGLAMPNHDRIQLKRGGAPVRAGLGMASFMPRRGYDTGGGATDDDTVNFDDRFSGKVADAAPGWSTALSPVSPVAAAYGQDNPYAPAPLPANQNVPGPTAGVGNAVSYGTPPQGDFPAAPGASAAPAAGVGAPEPPLRIAPPTAPSVMPQAGVGSAPPEPMDVYQNTIKHMETGTEKNPYGSMVPSVDPKTGATRYAVGAYGVMDSNIPQWTKQALGRPMTVQQFAADPSAQDAVFRAKFGEYADKYGPEGAARAWLAGEGGMNNPNVKDRFGTDPLSYGRKFANSIVGAGMTTPSSANAQLPANSTPTQGQAPPQDAPAPAQKGFGLLGLLSPDVGMSAMSAGLGMMASRSPFLGSAIGEGGLQGLSTYSNLQQQHIAQSEKQQDLDLKVKQLNQAAKSEQDKLALATKAQEFAETQMTPAQKAEADFRERNLQRENLAPIKIGTDPMTGGDIFAVRDANAPSGFRRLDANALGGPQPGQVPPTAPGAAPTSQEQLPTAATPTSLDIKPTAANEEFLKTLDPAVAAQVKALDEGRMAFPAGFAMKTPYWQARLNMLAQYDPSFDAVNYNSRAKTRADFVAGKSAQNITSFNTAIGHLDTLDKAIDPLGNTRFGWVNPMLQSTKSAMGDTQFQASQKQFMAAKQAVTDELTRAFRGSGGNVHDIVGWEQTLNQADSPAALHAATKAAVELLRSRVESVGDQYNRGMGTTRDPLTMLSPRAQAAVARLSGEAPSQSGGTEASSAPPVPGAKLYQGKWYTRGPNGESVPVTP